MWTDHVSENSIYASPDSAAYMRHWIGWALVQIMACRLFGAKPLSKQMQGYFNETLGTYFGEILVKIAREKQPGFCKV